MRILLTALLLCAAALPAAAAKTKSPFQGRYVVDMTVPAGHIAGEFRITGNGHVSGWTELVDPDGNTAGVVDHAGWVEDDGALSLNTFGGIAQFADDGTLRILREVYFYGALVGYVEAYVLIRA